MRKAIRPNKSRQQTAKIGQFPPPTGGLNTRDTLSSIPPTEAVTLTNWIPDNGFVRTRPGYSYWASAGINNGVAVETLMEYASPTGANQFFAAAGGKIYDISATGTASTSLVFFKSNDRWQHTMFSTAAGNYLCFVNGADGYYTYDGATCTDQSASITGVTASTLIHICVHQSRLWFVQKNTLDAWYLPTSSIIGAATKFSLGAICRRGGYLLAMATWTHDGGSGPDDFAVFITSQGEIVVYQGTDPSSSSTWALVGRYEIATPIGRRCTFKAGGDLAILTSQGLIPMSQSLGVNQGADQGVAYSQKITPTFKNAYISSGTQFGWQTIADPVGNLVIVNRPISAGTTAEQFVLNASTGGWCKFADINANCWGIFNNGLYFGGTDCLVFRFDNYATSDQVGTKTQAEFINHITATMQHSFSTFGTPGKKRFTNARPLFIGPSDWTPQITTKVDFDTDLNGVQPATVEGTVDSWADDTWADDSWANDFLPLSSWLPLSGVGFTGSLVFSVSANCLVKYNGTEIMYESGGLV